MGLASALSTALTGLTAAETQIDVVGNNLANSQTNGFKESEVAFTTQFLQTLGLGSQPTSSSGGTNPRQTGLGTQVAGQPLGEFPSDHPTLRRNAHASSATWTG